MSLTELFKNETFKKSKRVGRGIAAGGGKTAGRGTKGQKARTGSGNKTSAWFEGGQTPLFRRIAKRRGFRHHQPEVTIITTTIINRFYQDGEIVSPETLLEKKIIRKNAVTRPIKVLKRSELQPKVTFAGLKTSRSFKATEA